MKIFILILMLATAVSEARAQAETPTENHLQTPAGVKDFGGFLLDMGTMLNAESLVLPPPTFSALSWNDFSDPSALPLLTPNPDALRIDTRLTSFGGMLDGVLNPNLASQVFPGTKGTRLDLRGVTYRLNNGLRISTYGEYDADGNRRYNPAALPWEKDDFNAALELKTDDGKFGLRIGVEKR